MWLLLAVLAGVLCFTGVAAHAEPPSRPRSGAAVAGLLISGDVVLSMASVKLLDEDTPSVGFGVAGMVFGLASLVTAMRDDAVAKPGLAFLGTVALGIGIAALFEGLEENDPIGWAPGDRPDFTLIDIRF